MVLGNDNRFFDRGQSPPYSSKAECGGNLEQSSIDSEDDSLPEPSAGTVPSVSYKKWGNVWLIYGSLR